MEKINIAEILRDCPQGTKLYSPMCGGCTLDNVDDCPTYPITIRSEVDRLPYFLTADGRYQDVVDAECLLFPSKDQKDWSKFQRPFKDGDILSNGICTCIYNGNESKNYYGLYVGVGHIDHPNYFILSTQNSYFTKGNVHLATEEEKQQLFQAIKDNGYTWNAEAKTLEKQEQKKFDITTLKPYDKVLVRDVGTDYWHPDLYGYHRPSGPLRYACISVWRQCIPYEGNEHLLGTTDDCRDYYKTWKED